MIDTDKYEGHTEGPWKIYYDKWNKTGWWIDSITRGGVGEYGDTVCRLLGITQNKDPTAKLIQDAPLILEDYKRLQGILTNTVAGKGSALTGKGNIVDIIQIRGGSENHGENVHFTVMYEGGQVLSGWLENKESGWRYDGGESDE